MTAILPRRDSRDGKRIALCIAVCTVIVHLLVARRYGYAEDEMYFVDCSHHLAAGYVDMPPLMAWLTWLVVHTLGTSLLALRFLPALAAGATAYVSAALARALGGQRWAQGMAALADVFCPMLMMWAHMFTMNVFEPLLWVAAAWCVVRIFSTEDPRWWLTVGALVGIGLLNKYSMGMFPAGLVLGLLLSPGQRRWLRSGWFWAGAGLALLIFLPNLLWMVRNDFPFLKHEHYARAKYGPGHGPVLFLLVQMIVMGPLLWPLWMGGLAWLFRRAGKQFRPLGWVCLAMLAVLMATRARDYYAMPPYPILFAAGSVAWEQWLAARSSSRQWVRLAYPVIVVLAGFPLMPVTLPVLDVAHYLGYLQGIGHLVPSAMRRSNETKVPVYFMREMGWPEMVSKVAEAYHALPPEQQGRTALLATSYQQSAAINFYAEQYGLPQTIGTEIAYSTWGPRDYTGDSVLLLGMRAEKARQWWDDVRPVGESGDMSATGTSEILLCTHPKASLQAMWPQMQIW
jgi:hypothetical protein